MKHAEFREKLLQEFRKLKRAVSTSDGDWVVKGFIDVYKNIYTISVDTKVISKIIELLVFPVISRFAKKHGYSMILSEYQNYYPDISFVAEDGTKIALDLKSTYRKDGETVNGFTLGSFTGYFRKRESTKNVAFAYGEYAAHFVLGVIYSRSEEAADEGKKHKFEQLEDIVSVVRDFTFLLQEKWRIASDHTGSGNTKNIGSVKSVEALAEGKGPFAPHGEDVFDDYWMSYLTEDMARAIDSVVPYHNLKEYWEWRKRATKRRYRRREVS